MKQLFLSFILALLPIMASADANGTCGDNLNWSYVETTKTLTISGTGAMYNYKSGSKAPWNNYQSSIQNAIIESGVTSLGDYAFDGCTSLTSVTIPNSVTGINYDAFNDCSGLTSVHITDLKAWCNIVFGSSESNPLSYAHHLYLNGKEITDLVIPNSVTSIGYAAFEGCSGLTSVTIPNSVTSIGSIAFEGCSGLTSITIPNSVTIIGSLAFYYCTSLTSVTIPNSVTTIGWGAFSGCTSLTSVTIGNGVTSIEESAFSNCSGLTSIKVESGNDVYDSRDNCNAIIETSSNTLLLGCKNTIIPNSVTSIGSGAFFNCSGLTSITFPNSVTTIGDYAFRDCSGLTSITIPQSVTSIGSGAFLSCRGLTSIKVESGNDVYDSRGNCNAIIETSSNTLFLGCKNTIIPNSVTSIGGGAFLSCSGLTSITIPQSVTSIERSAFDGCSGLTTIISLNNTPPTFSSWSIFYSVDNTKCIIWVPKGSVNAYNEVYAWNNFQNIRELILGDVNLDGETNYTDVNVLVDHIMGKNPEGFYKSLADLNSDDKVNAADVVIIIGTKPSK